MIILTLYRYRCQPLPDDLYEKLREGREWMPQSGKYDWYEQRAKYFWAETTLREAKKLSFGLEYVAFYCLEDEEISKRLIRAFFDKRTGVQKTVPGAVALQIVYRSSTGRCKVERYQWGQLAGRRAHCWCKVPLFSGIATELDTAQVIATTPALPTLDQ